MQKSSIRNPSDEKLALIQASKTKRNIDHTLSQVAIISIFLPRNRFLKKNAKQVLEIDFFIQIQKKIILQLHIFNTFQWPVLKRVTDEDI